MPVEPERTYGVLGDLHYYVARELDEEDGHHQWTVTVMLGEEHEEVAGWYWYDDNEIVVQKLDPFQPLQEQIGRAVEAIEQEPTAAYEVAASEGDAVTRILSGWEKVELVADD